MTKTCDEGILDGKSILYDLSVKLYFNIEMYLHIGTHSQVLVYINVIWAQRKHYELNYQYCHMLYIGIPSNHSNINSVFQTRPVQSEVPVIIRSADSIQVFIEY